MNMQTAGQISTERFLSFEDFDAPVDAWSLDELDQLSDLESVRSAWCRNDNPEN